MSRNTPTPALFSVLKRKGRAHQEVEDTEPQHVKGDADMAMVVKPVPHLNTHAATPTIWLVSDWILTSCQTQGHPKDNQILPLANTFQNSSCI